MRETRGKESFYTIIWVFAFFASRILLSLLTSQNPFDYGQTQPERVGCNCDSTCTLWSGTLYHREL